ncbi:MAG: response regulator [Bacteroidales bacterium]|nr:response regulator [Bacteroidales bacterium]
MEINKILIIEDENDLRNEIVDILNFENFIVFDAANGKEGLNIAFSQLPDLIICDIMMPEMDGMEVLKKIRSTPETILTPFIFITALADRNFSRKGMEMGADDYITKPFTIKELRAAIKAREKREYRIQDKIKQGIESVKASLEQRAAELETLLNNKQDAVDLLERKSVDLEMKLNFQNFENNNNILKTFEVVNIINQLKNLVETELEKPQLSSSEELLLVQLRNEIKNPNLLTTNINLLQLKFNQTNPFFINQLLKVYPQLTQNDLTLCTAIILNLNTQQISSLLNIDSSSVRKNKYRLKKKMGLNKEDKLGAKLHALNNNI